MPLDKELFNMILNTVVVPEVWTIGILLPIHKNEGEPLNPDSYS